MARTAGRLPGLIDRAIRAVSKLDSNGQRQERYVYAGGKKIATASPWQSVWVHEDPVTGSRPDAEFTADRINVLPSDENLRCKSLKSR